MLSEKYVHIVRENNSMNYNDFYRDLPIDSGDLSMHFSVVLLKELRLIHYHYPDRHDAAKACLNKARTYGLGDQNRIIWEACAENFRKGRLLS